MPRPQSSVESSSSLDPVRNRRPLVLVIDPDASSRSVLELALTRDGFEVSSAASRREGVALLQGRTPDAVVLEADLGGEEGFSLVAQLRGADALAKVPVLLLARAGEPHVEALAEVVGVDVFLRKPAFARDVAAMVRVELARAKGGPLRFDSKLLPPVQLLRALLSSPRSGRLLLLGGRAEVRFSAGRVLAARLEGHGGGFEALVRALALTGGRYELVLEAVDGVAQLRCTLRELVEVVVPRLERWARVVQRSLPLDARLAVDFGRLAAALESMPDGVNGVVQLFDGFRTLEQVLLDSPVGETLTLEIATRLYLMGVLAPAKDSDADLLVPRPMPRLFEPRATEAVELMHQLFGGAVELRAVEADGAAPAPDWFSPSVAASELEVADPAGGWTTAPVPEVLAAGLSPEVARQLEAFQTPMQVEAPQAAVEEAALRRFAGAPAVAPRETAMEAALHAATALPEVDEAELKAQLERFHAQSRGSQARIETPWMTPVVEAPPAPASPVAPQVDAQVEALFFQTAAPAPAEEAPDVSVAPRARRAWWPFLVGALAVAGLALGLDSSRPAAVAEPALPEAPAVVAAPALPEVAPAAPVPVAAEEEVAPVVAPDVSENLSEASRLYAANEFKRAISVLEQVVADDPGSVLGWNLMGLARYDARDPAGARAALDRVLALEPDNARAQILLATLHFDRGERAAGRAALERYLVLAPDGPEVAEVRALLARDR